jgi:hypothetical protein
MDDFSLQARDQGGRYEMLRRTLFAAGVAPRRRTMVGEMLDEPRALIDLVSLQPPTGRWR